MVFSQSDILQHEVRSSVCRRRNGIGFVFLALDSHYLASAVGSLGIWCKILARSVDVRINGFCIMQWSCTGA